MFKLFTQNDTPYGKSLTEWSDRWWRWLCGQPIHTNPATKDSEGKYSNNCQTFPQCHFLCGTTTSESVQRSCKIPLGKSILIPVICFEHSHLEMANASALDLFKLSSKELDGYKNINAMLGEESLTKDILRIRSPFFTMTLPRENIWNTENEGFTYAAADGHWIFINQIDQGQYTVKVEAEPKQENGLKINTTYELTVE